MLHGVGDVALAKKTAPNVLLRADVRVEHLHRKLGLVAMRCGIDRGHPSDADDPSRWYFPTTMVPTRPWTTDSRSKAYSVTRRERSGWRRAAKDTRIALRSLSAWATRGRFRNPRAKGVQRQRNVSWGFVTWPDDAAFPPSCVLVLRGSAIAASAVTLAAIEPGARPEARGPRPPALRVDVPGATHAPAHRRHPLAHLPVRPPDLQVDSELGLGTLDEVKNVGGVARVSYVLNRERARSDRVLHVDSGDIFEGAPVFNFFQGEPEARATQHDGHRRDGHREPRVRRRRAQRRDARSRSGRTSRSSPPTTLSRRQATPASTRGSTRS